MMELILIYIIRVIITSGVFISYYQLFLKDKTFHRFNRFFLLSSILLSLVLPFLVSVYFSLPVSQNFISLDSEYQYIDRHIDYNYLNILGFVLGLIALFLITRFILSSYKIMQLKKGFPKENYKGIFLYHTSLQNAPFTYFKNLFWKNSIKLESTIGKQIFQHEMTHIRQKHTYDKLIIEFVKCIFWFNPFYYILKHEIHLVHEYLADRGAFSKSDSKAFAKMLLSCHFSGDYPGTVNPLFSSSLKKRIKMFKNETTKFSYFRVFFGLLSVLVSFAISMLQLKSDIIKPINPLKDSVIHTSKNVFSIQQVNSVVNDTYEKLGLNDNMSLQNNDKKEYTLPSLINEDLTQTHKTVNEVNTDHNKSIIDREFALTKFKFDKEQVQLDGAQIKRDVEQAILDVQIANNVIVSTRL